MWIKLLRTLGTIWLCAFAVIFTIGICSIIAFDEQGIMHGIGEALWILSPFNVASFLVNVLSILPGILLFKWADKLEKKRKKKKFIGVFNPRTMTADEMYKEARKRMKR